jgi:hypothetical protein
VVIVFFMTHCSLLLFKEYGFRILCYEIVCVITTKD